MQQSQNLAYCVTKHGHAANLYYSQKKLLNSEEKGPTLSHINPEYKSEKFELSDYLYSDVYKINVGALIPEEQKNKLKETYGDNWLEKANGMYAKIERDIHDDTVRRFGKLQTIQEGQVLRGLLGLLKHKQTEKNDFKRIHGRVYSDFYRTSDTRMLCSEFIAHTTIAALYELNEQLKKDILEVQKKKEIKSPPDPGQVVTIPFEHENLERVHPDRLIQVLKKSGCIERYAPVPIVEDLFKKEVLEEAKEDEENTSRMTL